MGGTSQREACAGLRARVGVGEVLDEIAGILRLGPEQLDTDATGARLRDIAVDMAANGYQQDDPIRETFTCLGNKYSKLLLSILSTGTFRHSTLRRLASALAAERDVSQRMLTLRLRDLERDGFIKRTIIPTVPPTVEYSLTPLGRALNDEINRLVGWISSHSAEIRKSRDAFEERASAQHPHF